MVINIFKGYAYNFFNPHIYQYISHFLFSTSGGDISCLKQVTRRIAHEPPNHHPSAQSTQAQNLTSLIDHQQIKDGIANETVSDLCNAFQVDRNMPV